MSTLAFVDTETTGLDPHRHEIWEVGLILRHGTTLDDGTTSWGPDEGYLWQLPVNLAAADLIALNIGRYGERRHPAAGDPRERERALVGRQQLQPVPPVRLADDDLAAWADLFMHLTWGAHLVGAVPDFDARRLGDLLLRHGSTPAWHYHLVDVETLVAGKLGVTPPWRSDDLSTALGVPPPDETQRHTALGDAVWARNLYDAVYGTAPTDATP